MSDVFVSYSRKDRDLVVLLHDALQKKGRQTWVDWEGIPPTAEWLAEIRAAIEAADNFLFVLSPDSVASKICRLEVEHAVLHRKRLIPVVRRDVSGADMPESLTLLNWIFLREGDEFGAGFENVLRALDTDLAWVKEHTRLLVRALQWDGRNRNDAFLLRGSDLKAAETWLAAVGLQKEMRPTPLHGEYIAASRRGAAKRLRRLVGGVAFAAVVALVLAVLAWNQSRLAEERRVLAVANKDEADRNADEARLNADLAQTNEETAEARRREAEEQRQVAVAERNTALSRELATNSVMNIPVDPELSLLLAREAARVKPTEQAEQTLRSALLQSHVRMILLGHTYPMKAVAFRPDGKRLLTAAADIGLIWDAETGKRLVELKGHTGRLRHAAFSPDGRRVITAGDFEARIWDADTGALLHNLEGNEDTQTWAEFSPDGKLAVTAGGKEGIGDNLGRVWDVASGQRVAVLEGHRNALTYAEFSRDGRLVVTASADGTGAVWEARSGRRLHVLGGHGDEEPVVRARVSPDARRFLTASEDNTARLWDGDGKLVAVLRGHAAPLTAAAFSPDSRRVATAAEDGTARVWSAAKGTPIAELRGHTGPVFSLEFSGDGRWLLTASGDGTARVWEADAAGARQQRDPDMFEETKQVGWRTAAVLAGHRGSVQTAAFGPEGRRVATVGADQTVRIWEPHRWDPLRTFPAKGQGKPAFERGGAYLVTVPDSVGIFDWVRIRRLDTGQEVGEPSSQAVFSRDHRWAATGVKEKRETKVWDTRSWKPAATLPGDEARFSNDGSWLATSAGAGSLVWQTATWRRVADLPGRGGSFRDDGRVFCGIGPEAVLSWRIGTWQPLPSVPTTGPFPENCSYRPDGALVVDGRATQYTGDGRWAVRGLGDDLGVYDMRTGQLATRLEHGVPYEGRGTIAHFTLSPSGRYLGAALLNGNARIWEMGTWRTVAVLRGHRGELHHLAFSPDERFVATAGEDKSVRLWDLAAGQPFAELRGHSGAVSGVAFSPDGRLVATVSEDETAQVYRCEVCAPLDELLAIAAGQVTRKLTAAERARFLHDERAGAEDPDTLVARGRQRASSGDVAGATRLFEQAAERGAKLLRDPKREAEIRTAEGLLAASTRYAERLEVERAIEARRRSKALDPAEVKDPQREVWDITVGVLKSRARLAARDGRSAEAERLLRRAQGMDPRLKAEGSTQLVREWAIEPLREEAARASLTGNTAATLAILRKAAARAPGDVKDPEQEAAALIASAQKSLLGDVERFSMGGQYDELLAFLETRAWIVPGVSLTTWARLCASGTTSDGARVLPSCDRAVQMEPLGAGIRATRASVRALSGDLQGAAEDLAEVLRNTLPPEEREKLERVLAALRSGLNPFRKPGTGEPDLELVEELRHSGH